MRAARAYTESPAGRREGPEERLCLALAGTAARRELTRRRDAELLEGLDFDRLAAHLEDQRLLALLGTRVLELASGAAPDGFARRVEQARAFARRSGVGELLVTSRAQALLEESGIPTLPLKGVVLAERLYGDGGLRSSADIDLLVPAARLEDARRLLETLDFRVLDSTEPGDGGLPLLHHRLTGPDGTVVELHWRVHWYDERFAGDLLSGSVLDQEYGRLPSPLDDLAALLLFYERDGFAGLRLAIDVAAWWDRFGAQLGPQPLEPLLVRYPPLARALAAASAAASLVVGVPLLVRPARPGERRCRLACRLIDWSLRSEPLQRDAAAAVVDVLLAPPGQSRAIARRRFLVPLDGVPALRPELRGAGRVHLGLAAAEHTARTLRRCGIALWRAYRRGPAAVTA